MGGPPILDLSPRHPGTGRRATVRRVARFESAEPANFNAEKYVLLFASEKKAASLTEKSARGWIEAGASYVFWFAFYNASAPDDHPHILDTVVVVVDSVALEKECTQWIQENSK
jgi:hypothetical protein